MASDIKPNRPKHTVGEIFRRFGPEYSRTHKLPPQQRKVMRLLSMCRTDALGGHMERCDACDFEQPVYNTCGDRHCPNCQGKLARRWVSDRLDDLLNTTYFHCVFTIPDCFNKMVFGNEYKFYSLLFKAASQTLLSLSQKRFKGKPGIIGVLHTWGQTLWLHPHIHFIVTGGGLSDDGEQWNASPPDYFLDIYELSAEFRKRFCRLLRKAPFVVGDTSEDNAFRNSIDEAESVDWVVFCEKPLAGPAKVVVYIGRYTHSVAIGNHRILDIGDDGSITIDYKDYRKQKNTNEPAPHKKLVLTANEFIRRFLQHSLPPGFRKIRYYGLLAGPKKSAKLEVCRGLLGLVELSDPMEELEESCLCPRCGKGHMEMVGELPQQRGPPVVMAYLGKGQSHAA